jgi:hypothetical protein
MTTSGEIVLTSNCRLYSLSFAKSLRNEHLGGSPADSGGDARDHDIFAVRHRIRPFEKFWWCGSRLGRLLLSAKLQDGGPTRHTNACLKRRDTKALISKVESYRYTE